MTDTQSSCDLCRIWTAVSALKAQPLKHLASELSDGDMAILKANINLLRELEADLRVAKAVADRKRLTQRHLESLYV